MTFSTANHRQQLLAVVERDRRIEAAAIEAAETYQQANAGAPGASMFLAGMALGTSLDPDAQTAMRRGYLAQLPLAREHVDRWANRINKAARGG